MANHSLLTIIHKTTNIMYFYELQDFELIDWLVKRLVKWVWIIILPFNLMGMGLNLDTECQFSWWGEGGGG